MHKRIIIGLVVVLGLGAIVAGLVGAKSQQLGAMKAAANVMPIEAVTTAKAQQQTWNPTVYSVGTLTAENGVTLSAEIAGTVAKIDFESGAKVEKGTLLAQLDVSVEQAQLRSAEASAELARLNAERIRELRNKDTLAQADLDTVEAQLKQAVANAEAIRAAIEGNAQGSQAYDMPEITISVGAVQGEGQLMHVAFAEADGALYRAKEGGRNRYVIAENPAD